LTDSVPVSGFLFALFRSGEGISVSVKQGGIGLTSQQISLLRREIAPLERILSRLSDKG
jgi:hypothetical protein